MGVVVGWTGCMVVGWIGCVVALALRMVELVVGMVEEPTVCSVGRFSEISSFEMFSLFSPGRVFVSVMLWEVPFRLEEALSCGSRNSFSFLYEAQFPKTLKARESRLWAMSCT